MASDRFSFRKIVRQSRARETIDAILEASSRIVTREGVAGLTTNHVAELAGVSIGSLYQYFPGKDAVLHALVQREFNKAVDGHVAFIESLDPATTPIEEAIAGLVDQIFDAQKHSRPFLRAILMSVLSIRHLRFTLENDTRVLVAVRRKMAEYGVAGEALDTVTFVALHSLKGVQIGVVFAERSADDRQLRAAMTRAIIACVTPAEDKINQE